MRNGEIFGASVLLIVMVVVVVGTYLMPRVIREPAKYGNLSQVVQALAGIVFGVSSLSAAFTVFALQQNAGRDAALERAATRITRIHENSVTEERWLEVDDATIGNRTFDCMIYLKYRLVYTPHWTATQLHHRSYLMDPQELGRRPHENDLAEAEPAKRELIYGQFDKCIGHDETVQKEARNDGDEPQIRRRGAKIQRIISTQLASHEMALLEWPDLPAQARELTETTVAADLCASPSWQEDVFDLFEGLHASVERKDEARVFAQAFLAEYPHLDIFLRSVCVKKFRDMVNRSGSFPRPPSLFRARLFRTRRSEYPGFSIVGCQLPSSRSPIGADAQAGLRRRRSRRWASRSRQSALSLQDLGPDWWRFRHGGAPEKMQEAGH